MKKTRECRLYIASIILLFLFSCMFLILPISHVVPFQYLDTTNLCLGIGIWVTGILGYLMLGAVYRAERHKKSGERQRRIYLYTNFITAVSDSVFVIGVIVLATLIRCHLATNYWAYINLFIIVCSFNMHWIFSRDYHKKLIIVGSFGGETNE